MFSFICDKKLTQLYRPCGRKHEEPFKESSIFQHCAEWWKLSKNYVQKSSYYTEKKDS